MTSLINSHRFSIDTFSLKLQHYLLVSISNLILRCQIKCWLPEHIINYNYNTNSTIDRNILSLITQIMFNQHKYSFALNICNDCKCISLNLCFSIGNCFLNWAIIITRICSGNVIIKCKTKWKKFIIPTKLIKFSNFCF